MYDLTIILILVAMVIMLASLLKRISFLDKIMSINCFTNYTIVIIAIMSVSCQRYYLLDVALVYALVNFIASISFLKYFLNKKL